MSIIKLDSFDQLPQVSHISNSDAFVVYRKSQGEPVLLSSERFELIFGTGGGGSVEGDIVDRVETLEASFLVQAGLIEAKVSQTVFDDLESTVTNLQTSITLNSTNITLKADKSEFDELGNQVSSNSASIDINATAITQRVTSTTFNALEGRVTGAETDIDSAVTALATKADATVVAALDTRIGGAETNITANAQDILARVTQAAFDALESEVSSQSTLITQNAAEIDLRATKNEVDAIEGRVTTAEASITVNANEINQRVTTGTFNTLSGRVDVAESDITQNATAITQRVTQATFDTLEGRVTASETSINQNATDITLRATKTELNSSIEEVLESLTPAVRFQFLDSVDGWTGSGATLTAAPSTLLYDATAVGSYMQRTGLTVPADDNPIVYLRFKRTAGTGFAAKIEFTTDGTTWHEAALTEPADASVYNTYRVDVSGDVAYTGTVTGIRLYLGESAADEFEVDFVEVGKRGADALLIEDLDTRLSTAESEISVNANAITQRVTIATYNTLDGRVATAESNITQNATAITSKVSQVDFDALGNTVSTNTSSITQNATAITSKVSQSDFNDLGNRVSTVESEITQNADAITQRVTQSEFNTLGERVTTAESSITQNATSIESKVSQTEFNDLDTRVGTAESSITQNANAIQQRVTTTTFNDLDTRVGTAESNITQNATAITQRVTTSTFNNLEQRVSSAESEISQNADAIQLRVTATTFNALGDRVSTAESKITILEDEISSTVTQSDIDAINGRIDTAESNITQNATSITSKVSQTDFNALGSRVDTTETQITQNANAIQQRVTTSTFNALGDRVTTAETNITQTSEFINSEVLAGGKTRSRMTQDMDGFTFEADRFQSANFNGTINSNGAMTSPGTQGWAFDKNGVMSVKQAFIAGFDVGVGGISTDRFKAGDMDIIGGSDPSIQIADAVSINARNSIDFNDFLGGESLTVSGNNMPPGQTVNTTFAMPDNGIVISRLIFSAVDSELPSWPGSTSFIYLFDINIQGRRVSDGGWETISAGRYDYGQRPYQDPMQGAEQDPVPIVYDETATPIISAEPSPKYDSYRYSVINQSFDGLNLRAIYRRPINPSTEINKAGAMFSVGKAIKSFRIFASPDRYIDLVADNVVSGANNRLGLVAKFYKENELVGEESLGEF